MFDDPDNPTKEEKQKLKIALAELIDEYESGQLNAFEPLPAIDEALRRAVRQATRYPQNALADAVWSIQCVWLDGKTVVLYTSDEAIAKECTDHFGWVVEKNTNPTYKYSKSLYHSKESTELHWREWISPPGQSFGTFMGDEFEWIEWMKWECCTVQIALWWAMEMRRPFARDNKDTALDLEGTLLPKKYADDLVEPMGHPEAPLSEKIKDWVRRSASHGPEDSRFDSAHEWYKLPL